MHRGTRDDGYPTANLRFNANGIAVVMSSPSGIFNFFLDAGLPSEQSKQITTFSGQRKLVAAFTGLTRGPHTLTVMIVAGSTDLDGAIISR